MEVGNKVKGVFTLVHGFTNSGDDWMQMTAAPRYAADNGLALVAPDCGNSFYQDMTYGGAWAGFVTEELPVLLREMFHLPAEREKNFIGGLSMGGYGALYLGLSRPDLYAGLRLLLRRGGCGHDAGALPHPRRQGGVRAHLRAGPAPAGGQRSPAAGGQGGRSACGPAAEDPAHQRLPGPGALLHPLPERLGGRVPAALPLAHYRRLQWDGVHEWNFWDRSLVYAIDDFVNPGYAAKKLNDWAAPVTETGGAPRG